MAEHGDVVRHLGEGWVGVVTRDLGQGRVEAWEKETCAPYAMPHSVEPADLEILVPGEVGDG
jgi:hypothetical protein